MQTHQRKEYIDTPVMPEATLHKLAEIYGNNTKIKSRVTFVEFVANPDLFLSQSKYWADTQWKIQFTKIGDHEKIWVNDTVTGATIMVEHIPADKPQDINMHLTRLAASLKKPESIIVDDEPNNFNHATLRAWCRINKVAISEISKKRKPHVMGAFDQESTEVA